MQHNKLKQSQEELKVATSELKVARIRLLAAHARFTASNEADSRWVSTQQPFRPPNQTEVDEILTARFLRTMFEERQPVYWVMPGGGKNHSKHVLPTCETALGNKLVKALPDAKHKMCRICGLRTNLFGQMPRA